VKTPVPSGNLVRFGVFELDLRARELRKDGLSTGLPEQAIKILALLLEKPGEVVLREEIRKTLWPNDTIVEFDHSINAAMKRLRQALGESADNPQYIETLARRGYRWKVPARRQEAAPAPPDVPAGALPESGSFASNLIGKKVSHYRVLEVLGGGGMGVVFKAEDIKLGRRVAVKFLPEELADEPKALERFEREARAASALDHTNICSIYEFGEHEGKPFIVMQLLEGQTLRERIGFDLQHAKPLPTEELLDVAIQIARGLEAAHQKGIIHRDIKPANIFITDRGEAKILDFGVAKLSADHVLPDSIVTSGSIKIASLRDMVAPVFLNLTLTGVNLGTASYMSPEQILGEKLDPRSDLFSFGLVLYEMSTGQHPFGAEPAELVRAAILHRPVQPARRLNPELPEEIEKVIAKTLHKDSQSRYQHASEIRADLEALREKDEPEYRSRWREMTAGGVALLLIASTIFWFTKPRQSSPQVPLAPNLRQLTVNSFENRVLSGAISPDGKYLAYADVNGVHIQLVEIGETRTIPRPEELKDKQIEWEIVTNAWFPDSSRFLFNAHASGADGSSKGTSIWMASVLGGAPTKLRDNATAYSVSRDGSLISFGTKRGRLGDREIWLMQPSGEWARRLFDTDENSSIAGTDWSRDGQRIIYVRTDDSGDNLVSRDLKGGPLTTIFPPSEMRRVNEAFWLADGRLIYSVAEPEDFLGNSCNFWEMRLDSRTGKPIEKPKRITNWSGYCMSGLSATSDGKRLVFLRWVARFTSYVGDLAADSTRILNLRHFPLTESSDAVTGWSADSDAIFLVSNRSGHIGIYKQPLNEDTAEPLLIEGVGQFARVTPDGQNIIYLGSRKSGDWRAPEPVMRVPLAGGPSQLLFVARPFSLLTCAKSPSTLCVIAEPTEDRKQVIFTALDPMKGRGPELFRFAFHLNDDRWFSDLSPDGARIAAMRGPAGPIYVFSLHGQPEREIRVKGWSNLSAFIWAADGKSLFVTAGVRGRRVVLHVDLLGNARVLWETPGEFGEAVAFPSPDDRKLALRAWTTSGNMWSMEKY
jgi:eukaryotic-like serine/threonine-protein kinase